jgi:multicomponent Na+:H+ antiporter subunit G
MQMILRILIDFFVLVGAYFALAGTIGVMKMPDTFSRMQASTCVTTMGVIGVGIGALLYAIFFMGSGATAVKVCVICGLVLATNPVGSHAIAKGAYQAGIRPRKKMETEDYRRDFNE